MSNTNTGGPAFPVLIVDRPKELEHFNGMTLRDYFAAKAMQAFISAYPCQAIDEEVGGIAIDHECVAIDSYEMADAMLKERTK